MDFDLDEGLYIFEVTLAYQVGDAEHLTAPFVLQADDSEEAEEIVLEYLEELRLAGKFWLAELNGPYDPQEYQVLVDEGERDRWDRLKDCGEEDFLEILQSDDL
ncbi:MAG: hypothetical protein ACLFVT_02195 [Syntrophobacteria bacterium]